ncbi:biotin--[acetyl-CoA-carboxylase] ligase [Mucilaginibacter glaciei]|uniref:biotin--[acetyl-CoA-carboxylase] ligase n=1 Tax=Mucilaginibacter glaciei TaxID=2772109 RepID=UPI00293BC9EE|nr:biotin--[acetyl-CoA-carboxylase] ligase [Mucilaginibacter glaciei]
MTLKQVDSTNTYLKDMLSKSKPVPEGTVIMAEDQFAGRGQRENTWHTEPGKNLTFSILLKPSFVDAQGQYDVTRAASLGVYDALQPLFGGGLKIKWPNDIYYGDKKLGGMLIENILQGSQIKASIVGIGLNVNQDNFTDNTGNATSIKQILHRDYELKNILAQICNHIEGYYLQLKAGRTDFVRNTYLSRLYWLNEAKPFRSNGQTFTGTINNVTDNGLLVVEHEGKVETFNFKEIEFLNK